MEKRSELDLPASPARIVMRSAMFNALETFCAEARAMEREPLDQYPDPQQNLPQIIDRLRSVNDAMWALLFISVGSITLLIKQGLVTPAEALDRLRHSRVLLAQAMGNNRAALLLDEVILLFQALLSADSPDELETKLGRLDAELSHLLKSWPSGPTRH